MAQDPTSTEATMPRWAWRPASTSGPVRSQPATISAFGYRAGRYVAGDGNTGLGNSAGNNVTGSDNVALGTTAGRYVLGASNVAIGSLAGIGIEGDNNVAIGRGAATGVTYDASTMTFYDYDGNVLNASPAVELQNVVAIGDLSYVTANSAVAIGAGRRGRHR